MIDISHFELVWGDEFTELKLSDASTRGDANWSTKSVTPAWFAFKGAASGVFNKVTKGDSDSVLEIKMRKNAQGALESGLISNVFPDQSSAAGMTSPVGYYEARLWMPDMIAGIWPAFWAMGMGRFDPARKRTPELDVLEWYGPIFPDRFSTGAHEWRDTGGQHDHTWTRKVVGRDVLHTGFHLYGLEIDASLKQTYYFDREPYFELYPDSGLFYDGSWAATIGNKPLAWMINFAAGAGWPIDPELGAAKPASLFVDYFRIYQRVTTTEAQIAAQIADLNTQITTLKAQIAQLNARVWNRDTTIRTLNEQINRLEASIAALTASNAAFKSAIGAGLSDIQAQVAALQQLN